MRLAEISFLNYMVTDHSKTYKLTDLRNIAHMMRLRGIINTLVRLFPIGPKNYADYGCSNGFVTAKIVSVLNISDATGYDYTENLEIGNKRYPNIKFNYMDLNNVNECVEKYELVTCFETLEHVGNLENAICNLLNSVSEKGVILITVPIEIGLIGLFKYFIKRFLFRYELPLLVNDLQYIRALVGRKPIAKFRKSAQGYGSHFGFDYREVDKFLTATKNDFYAHNKLTTRFYIIK